jgi:hypothetical protein
MDLCMRCMKDRHEEVRATGVDVFVEVYRQMGSRVEPYVRTLKPAMLDVLKEASSKMENSRDGQGLGQAALDASGKMDKKAAAAAGAAPKPWEKKKARPVMPVSEAEERSVYEGSAAAAATLPPPHSASGLAKQKTDASAAAALPPPAAAQPAAAFDWQAEMMQLKELKDVLTDEEFESEKAKIMVCALLYIGTYILYIEGQDHGVCPCV